MVFSWGRVLSRITLENEISLSASDFRVRKQLSVQDRFSNC